MLSGSYKGNLCANNLTGVKYYNNPQMPVHVLIVPKKHIACVNDMTEDDVNLVGHAFLAAKKIAAEKGLENGYRIINNCGEDAGQTVKHIHFHLLAGKTMGDKII